MINPRTQGVTIIVDELGLQFHSINDWGLAIGNNNYIGTPILYTNYIQVPGANKLLDASQALTGRRTYISRPINIELGSVRKTTDWDLIISSFRNRIDGRVVRLIFDNDELHYWTGRVQLTDFDRVGELGTFTLSIPTADPYKYNINSNIDPWLWDSFNFESDSIPAEPIIYVDGVETLIIPVGSMYTVPKFTVNEMERPLSLTLGNKVYAMKNGENYFPTVMVNGDEEVVLTFSGKGQILFEYRGGSL